MAILAIHVSVYQGKEKVSETFLDCTDDTLNQLIVAVSTCYRMEKDEVNEDTLGEFREIVFKSGEHTLSLAVSPKELPDLKDLWSVVRMMPVPHSQEIAKNIAALAITPHVA